LFQVAPPAKVIYRRGPKRIQQMALFGSPGPKGVKRSVKRYLSRTFSDFIKLSPITLPGDQKKVLETPYSGLLRIIGRKSDWEIESDQGTSIVSHLTLDPC
jgi:hypothetical protein